MTVLVFLRNAREGDFLETHHNLIFDVKGLVHPPDRVIAFLRYYPSVGGERKKGDTEYKKVYSFEDRFNALKAISPSYIYYDKVFGSMMQGVPRKDVAQHYQPTAKLVDMSNRQKDLDDFQKSSLELCTTLSNSSRIPLGKLGVSGSILVDLHTPNSDIDMIVYGSRNCHAVYEAIGSLFAESDSVIRPYNDNELKKLFEFRSSDTYTIWRSFLRTERRKRLQGVFENHEYFLRFIKERTEVGMHYGDVTYKSAGRATIKAMVVDDSDALFTPCEYKITGVHLVDGEGAEVISIKEVTSFRGRFCDIAKVGERIIARGKLEIVTEKSGNSHHRLLVGGERDDFLTLA